MKLRYVDWIITATNEMSCLKHQILNAFSSSSNQLPKTSVGIELL